jgi:hypothetical protein
MLINLRGRALVEQWELNKFYWVQINSEYLIFRCGRQTYGDKILGQKGNSPDYKLRPLNFSLVDKDIFLLWQSGGGLRGSHPLKKA